MTENQPSPNLDHLTYDMLMDGHRFLQSKPTLEPLEPCWFLSGGGQLSNGEGAGLFVG